MPEIDAKKFYNEIMPTKQGEDYEHARWHSSAIAEVGYEQTKQTIDAFLTAHSSVSSILELGPGAGTWSKRIRAKYPQAKMTLVDISKEMLGRAKKVLGTENVTYIESAFEDFQTQERFDFFLSSRVIEYIDEKDVFAQKLFEVLEPGAKGLIITKLPHYTRMKMQGKKVSALHTGQITPEHLIEILQKVGFSVVKVRPVTVSVPLCKSAMLNTIAGNILRNFSPNMLTATCIESYAVEITK